MQGQSVFHIHQFFGFAFNQDWQKPLKNVFSALDLNRFFSYYYSMRNAV